MSAPGPQRQDGRHSPAHVGGSADSSGSAGASAVPAGKLAYRITLQRLEPKRLSRLREARGEQRGYRRVKKVVTIEDLNGLWLGDKVHDGPLTWTVSAIETTSIVLRVKF